MRNRTNKQQRTRRIGFEQLESRRVLASSASFNAITGKLLINGDGNANSIVVTDSGVNLAVLDGTTYLINPQRRLLRRA